MGFIVRQFLVLIVGLLLTCDDSDAQIKYSFGPVCRDTDVVCPDSNEIPICFSTSAGVRIETIDVDGVNVNRFQPSCNFVYEDAFPNCVDITQDGKSAPKHIVLGCVEFPKCAIEKDNELIAVCSQGKIAKCLGGDEKPDCKSVSAPCGRGIAVCDYTWQAQNF